MKLPEHTHKLLNDFDTFLDYIKHENVRVTKTNGYIQRKHCGKLNEQFEDQELDVTQYSDQIYYAKIHLYYHLAESGSLLSLKDHTLVLEERVERYREFSDLEKYMFLLETFWVDMDWRVFRLSGNEDMVYIDVIRLLPDLVQFHPGEWHSVVDRSGFYDFYKWSLLIKVFHHFGFWEYRERNLDYPYTRGMFVSHLKISDFGHLMLLRLMKSRRLTMWSIPARKLVGERIVNPGSLPSDEIDHDFYFEGIEAANKGFKLNERDQVEERFLDAFKDMFSDGPLEKAFPREKKEPFTGDIYFQTETLMGGEEAIIQCSSEHSMEALHEAILEAYGLYDDHLYMFFMDGVAWSQHPINSPYDMDGPFADEMLIGDLGLKKGQSFLYIHNPILEWRLKITVKNMVE